MALILRSRVDIIRDGRLITSRIYDAGNQTLDTSSLPDGSYPVSLRIQEAGGVVREERRFFSKNASVPARGEGIFFAYGGVLAPDRLNRILSSSGTPFFEGGAARRLNAHLAVDATMMTTNRRAIGELGAVLLRTSEQIRMAGLVSSHGGVGVILQVNSSGLSKLNYSIDARKVWNRDGQGLFPADGTSLLRSDNSFNIDGGGFTEGSGVLNYRLGKSQVGVSGSYWYYADDTRYYAISPTAYVPLAEKHGMQVILRGDATISNRGTSAFLGLSFVRFRAHSTIMASASVRSTNGADSENGTAAVGGIGATLQRDNFLGANVAVAGSLAHEVDGTLVRGRADVHTRSASFYADAVQPLGSGKGGTQYSANAKTSFSIGGGDVVFEGQRQDDSMIIVSVDGAAPHAPFEVFVDGTPRGKVHRGGYLAMSLPSYRRYTVRVKSVGDGLLRLDGGMRQVSMFPGTVARIRWRARPVLAMFGRLAWPDGSVVTDAAITADGEIAQSDGQGFFQLEAPVGSVLDARLADGRMCSAKLLPAQAENYGALGTIVCTRHLPQPIVAELKSRR